MRYLYGQSAGAMTRAARRGYRVYFLQDGEVLILLLCGGDKSLQQKDIDKVRRLADEWRTDTKEARDEQHE